MSDITYRDRQAAPVLPEGEQLVAELRADRARYIRDHVSLTAIGGVIAVIVLWALGKTDVIWVGILGVMAAMLLRGVWLYPDYMRAVWILTDKAVIGPGQVRYDLADLTRLRAFLGDVQLTTSGGRRTLIKFMADPQATIARITAARDRSRAT